MTCRSCVHLRVSCTACMAPVWWCISLPTSNCMMCAHAASECTDPKSCAFNVNRHSSAVQHLCATIAHLIIKLLCCNHYMQSLTSLCLAISILPSNWLETTATSKLAPQLQQTARCVILGVCCMCPASHGPLSAVLCSSNSSPARCIYNGLRRHNSTSITGSHCHV